MFLLHFLNHLIKSEEKILILKWPVQEMINDHSKK